MLRSVPGASWLLLDDDGNVTYGAGEVAGAAHLADVVHPDDLTRVLDGVSSILDDPSRAFVDDVRVSGADEWRPAELTAVNRVEDAAVGGIVVRILARNEPAARHEPAALPPLPDDLIGSLAEAVPTPILVADQSGIVVFSN